MSSYYIFLETLILTIVLFIIFYLVIIKKNNIYYNLVIYFTFAVGFFSTTRIAGTFSLEQFILVLLSISFYIKTNNSPKEVIKENNYNSIKKITYIYIVYLVTVTLLFYYPVKDYKLIGGVVQNDLRPVVQSIQVIIMYIAFLSVLRLSSDKAVKIIRYFHSMLLLFAIIGIFQGLIYLISGFDLFPIKSITGDLVSATSQDFLRITAGFGEPKHLAKYLSFAIALTIFMPTILNKPRTKYITLIILIIALILTFSTTGYITLSFILLLYSYNWLRTNPAMFMMLLSLTFIIVFYLYNTDVVSNKLERQVDNGVILGLENTDSASLLFLLDNPVYLITGVGISNVVGYASSYLPLNNIEMGLYPFTLRRGIIVFLTEGGLIGLILQILLLYRIYTNIKKNKETKIMGIFVILSLLLITTEGIFIMQIMFLSLLVVINKRPVKNFKIE